MLIHEFDSVSGLVDRPTDEAIERDRQRQLEYLQVLIHKLTERNKILRVSAKQVVAA